MLIATMCARLSVRAGCPLFVPEFRLYPGFYSPSAPRRSERRRRWRGKRNNKNPRRQLLHRMRRPKVWATRRSGGSRTRNRGINHPSDYDVSCFRLLIGQLRRNIGNRIRRQHPTVFPVEPYRCVSELCGLWGDSSITRNPSQQSVMLVRSFCSVCIGALLYDK